MRGRAVTNHTQVLWSTLLLGVGVMAAIDEIVFHQLLHWHHFYDGASSETALFSDGILHGAELVLMVAGFFIFKDAVRQGPVNRGRAWGGFLTGAGGFQLFDGLVDHKVLNLHEIRYDVEILPYDLAWNGFGLFLLIAGIALLRSAAEREP